MKKNLLIHSVVHRSLFLFLSGAGLHLSTPAVAQVTFSNTDTIYIQDGTSVPIPGNPYPSEISVAKQKGLVSKAEVTLYDMHHNFPDGIDLLLVAPDGSNTILLSDVGGAPDIAGVTVTITDDAAEYFNDRLTFVSGTYKPTNMGNDIDLWPASAPASSGNDMLSALRGTEPNGTWRLYAVSDMEGTYGVIAGGWALTLYTEKKLAQTEIESFAATFNHQDNLVDLTWQTTDEFNTSKFIIERAGEGAAWISVGEVAAKSVNKNNSYQFEDTEVTEGKYRYRIKMIFKDGTEQYSNVRMVKVEPISYNVYPNPARSFTFVVSDSKVAQNVTITVTDIYNNIMLVKTGSLSKNSPIRLELMPRYTGPHYLAIKDASGTTTVKVINIIK